MATHKELINAYLLACNNNNSVDLLEWRTRNTTTVENNRLIDALSSDGITIASPFTKMPSTLLRESRMSK